LSLISLFRSLGCEHQATQELTLIFWLTYPLKSTFYSVLVIASAFSNRQHWLKDLAN
jgi:hypothetical protein